MTDDLIRQLKAPAGRNNRITWDADADGAPDSGVTGFGAVVTPNGTKSLIFDYRVRDTGVQRRYTLGKFPALKVEPARKKARRLREEVLLGADPQGERAATRSAPRFRELAERFDTEYLPKRRQSTQENYRRLLRLHILPALGHLRVADVAFADIEAMHRKVTREAGRHQANRALAVTSRMLSLAVRWQMRTDGVNPCRGIERHREHPRRRYLSPDEVGRLVTALAAHSDRQAADAVRLMLLTGCRKSEAMAMRWGDLDLAAGVWNRHGDTLKGGRHHSVPLSAPARALLSGLRDQQMKGRRALGEYVFPSAASRTKHLVEVRKLWRNVVKAADLGDARIHDLRHTHASILASDGASLPLIGSLLGHASAAVTQRYAHLYDDPQRAAVERVGAIVSAAMHPDQPPADVVAMKRRGR